MQTLRTLGLDVSGLTADATVIDTLARLALGLRRCGYQLRLHHPSAELLQLIEFSGLSETLVLSPDSTEPRC